MKSAVVPPNPEIAAFFRAHATRYDPATDDYRATGFCRDITATKATTVYAMHSYHQGKKPHEAIRAYIRHYTRPGDLVLDPFCGSGGTALAALLEDRLAVGLDLSPAATFIARGYCTPADPAALKTAFTALMAAIRPELEWLYETRCDRCGGKARTMHTVYSRRFRCPRCETKVALFDCPAGVGRTAAGKPKKIAVCPICRAAGHEIEISTRTKAWPAVPVLAAYRCLNGCQPATGQRRHDDAEAKKRQFFTKFDLSKIREIEREEIPYWWPDRAFPQTFARWQTDLRPAGIRSVADLYTRRNLHALAAIRAQAVASAYPEQALFALTAIALAVSRMQRYSPRSGFPNMLLVGTYYLPPIGREIEVGSWYEGKLRALVRGHAEIKGSGVFVSSKAPGLRPGGQNNDSRPLYPLIATADARAIAAPDDAVDYIFTDPPYADAVQYGELNFVWESWLGAAADWHAGEIVVNAARGKTDADWAAAIGQAMRECFRVLKPGRWLSLCYHDTSAHRWALVQDLMQAAGFVIDAANVAGTIDSGQKSFNQLMSDKATKRDLVVNFRKPRPGESPPAVVATDAASFEALARQILRAYLEQHRTATKDRIYDDLVRHLLRRGRMHPHDFDALLRSVAVERRSQTKGSTWRLK